MINKFRNKYSINPGTERDLDTLIQDEVNHLILEVANVSENQLTALDKAISSTVNAARGIEKTKNEDAQSVKSHVSVQSRPKSEAEYSQKSGALIKKKEV